MKLTKISQIEEFLSIANSCESGVFLRSLEGDVYNLKSQLSQYIAMGALLGERGDDLELFCDSKTDELKFLKFLHNHPEI